MPIPPLPPLLKLGHAEHVEHLGTAPSLSQQLTVRALCFRQAPREMVLDGFRPDRVRVSQ